MADLDVLAQAIDMVSKFKGGDGPKKLPKPQLKHAPVSLNPPVNPVTCPNGAIPAIILSTQFTMPNDIPGFPRRSYLLQGKLVQYGPTPPALKFASMPFVSSTTPKRLDESTSSATLPQSRISSGTTHQMTQNSAQQQPLRQHSFGSMSQRVYETHPLAQSFADLVREEEPLKTFTCKFPSCKKNFPSRINLKRHQMAHLGRRPHRCQVEGCHLGFTTMDGLKKHQNMQHGPNAGQVGSSISREAVAASISQAVSIALKTEPNHPPAFPQMPTVAS